MQVFIYFYPALSCGVVYKRTTDRVWSCSLKRSC